MASVFICDSQARDTYYRFILLSFQPADEQILRFLQRRKERKSVGREGCRITEENEKQKVERATLRGRKEADLFKMPPTTGHTPLSRCLQRICLRVRMRPQSFFGCFARCIAVYIRARNKCLLRCFRRRKKLRLHGQRLTFLRLIH